MAENKKSKTASKPTKTTAKKAAPNKTAATAKKADDMPEVPVDTASNKRDEAKGRFSNALEEAKAGAAALRDEASQRAETYRDQAKDKSGELVTQAKGYSEQAKSRAGQLATDGKSAASDAIGSLGKVVGETAGDIDSRFGEQYGDYARKASRGLTEASAKLDAKSVEEIGEDARDMVRKSPAAAVGIAAVVGFLVARMFTKRD